MHPLALQLPAQGLAELGQSAFDAGVGRIERRRNERDAGRDVDDEAILARPQRRQGRTRQQDRRNQVDLDHRPDFGLRRVLKPAGPHSTRIVDEYIETAERLQRKLERYLTPFLGAEIRSNGSDAPAALAKLLGGVTQNIGASACNCDFCAFCQHRFGDCESNATGAAGDQRLFSLKYHLTSLDYLAGIWLDNLLT